MEYNKSNTNNLTVNVTRSAVLDDGDNLGVVSGVAGITGIARVTGVQSSVVAPLSMVDRKAEHDSNTFSMTDIYLDYVKEYHEILSSEQFKQFEQTFSNPPNLPESSQRLVQEKKRQHKTHKTLHSRKSLYTQPPSSTEKENDNINNHNNNEEENNESKENKNNAPSDKIYFKY